MITIPTPTTETNIIDAQEITYTTWAVGDYTLTRIEREDTPANWRTARLNNDAPHVSEDPSDWRDENATITYSVNWSARGDRSPAEALEYAARIMGAADAACVFTAIRAENK